MKKTKLKPAVIAAIITSCASLGAVHQARADQNNIDSAMRQAVGDYKSGGAKALTNRAKLCYDGVDYRRGSNGAAKGVEYCMSYEFAAIEVLNTKKEWTPTQGYFTLTDVFTRAGLYLEKARVVTLPEQFGPYWKPRSAYIQETIPGML